MNTKKKPAKKRPHEVNAYDSKGHPPHPQAKEQQVTVLERLKELERYKRLGQDGVYTQNCRRELIDNALPHLIAMAEAAADFSLLVYGDPRPDAPALFKDVQERNRAALAELTKRAGDER